MASPEYPKTAVNKLGRLPNRGKYDYATIHTLVNDCPILHVSFNDPAHEFPVVLPMLGCTGNFENQDADPSTTEQSIYIHGYISSRIFSQTGTSTHEKGLPITITATFLDALVLALSPFHHSCNYRSATLYGHATLLAPGGPESLYALEQITNNMLPGRWEAARGPPTPAEIASTRVLRVGVVSASAKVRTGGPSEDRVDAGDAGLVGGCGRGWCRIGGFGGKGLGGGRVRENGRAKGYAFGAAVEKLG
ncbi:hypothetical protein GQ44DRAFT_816469 [Phaeosphaeriaceae sp. PMI808]|nr:hypothetical protein GQ44DRAFT_816469 [Phaeosphaeriaceae sp. PMI808]